MSLETIHAKTILSGYRDGKDWFGSHYGMNLRFGVSVKYRQGKSVSVLGYLNGLPQ